MAFATEADVMDRLGLTELTDAQSMQIAVYLDEATDLIQALTGQQITAGTSTVTVAGGRRQVVLPQIPVTAVTVTVDAIQYQSYHYTWTSSGILTRLGALWPSAFTVTYSHGYATVPGPLVRLCARLAADMMNERPAGVSRESIGSYSVTYADAATMLTGNDMVVLESYKQVYAP